jgi:hypothetical protein
LRAKAVEEFKIFAALSVYPYIGLGTVLLFKTAILSEAGDDIPIWGIAAPKAIVLGKFMLLGRMLHVGKRYPNKPLVWPTLYVARGRELFRWFFIDWLVDGSVRDRLAGRMPAAETTV